MGRTKNTDKKEYISAKKINIVDFELPDIKNEYEYIKNVNCTTIDLGGKLNNICYIMHDMLEIVRQYIENPDNIQTIIEITSRAGKYKSKLYVEKEVKEKSTRGRKKIQREKSTTKRSIIGEKDFDTQITFYFMYKGTHKIRLMLFTNGTISISGLNIELIYEYTDIIQSFIEIVKPFFDIYYNKFGFNSIEQLNNTIIDKDHKHYEFIKDTVEKKKKNIKDITVTLDIGLKYILYNMINYKFTISLRDNYMLYIDNFIKLFSEFKTNDNLIPINAVFNVEKPKINLYFKFNKKDIYGNTFVKDTIVAIYISADSNNIYRVNIQGGRYIDEISSIIEFINSYITVNFNKVVDNLLDIELMYHNLIQMNLKDGNNKFVYDI